MTASGPTSMRALPSSDARRRIEQLDWSCHPLGPRSGWPSPLTIALNIVLASPEPMYLVWRETDSFFCNDAYAPLLGQRLEGATGAAFRSLWGEAWPLVRVPFEQALGGMASRCEAPSVACADHATPRDTRSISSYAPLLDACEAVVGVLCLTTKATATVPSRGTPMSAEARDLQILDSAIDYAIIATDLDGRITRWNEGARRTLGWTEEEMLGRSVERFFTPEDVAAGRVAVEMQCALETGVGIDERWHIRRDGTRFWATGELTLLRNEAGAAIGLVKILRDRTDAHEAAQALRVAETGLRRAQQAGGVGMFSLDIAADRLTGSPEFFRIFGRPVAEGMAVQELERQVLLEDRDRVYASAHRTSRNLPPTAEYRIHRVDTGEVRWIRRRAEAERGEDGRQRLVGVVQDVTDQVEAREALATSETRFRALAQAMPNHVWTGGPDGRIDWANDTAFQFSGRSQTELMRDGWENWLHPDDLAIAGASWSHALRTGGNYETEFRIRRADGTYIWHLVRGVPLRDADGTITGWLGTNTDIEEQRAAREILRARAAEGERERDLLWTTSNELMGTAGLDGYLKKINPAWQRVLGWDEATLLGRPFFAIIDPADHAETMRVVSRLAAGETVTGFMDHIHTRDGGQRMVTWNAVPDGDIFYIVGRDVTDQYNAEERLRQSQKMEAVGQLTGGIAHDFNNMLTGVIGSMELLRRFLAEGRFDRVQRYIDAASTSAQRAAALTQRLLAFSRRQSLDIRAVDVNELVGGMEDLLRRTLGENVGLEIMLLGEVWRAVTDANQLENALLNMAINARDAMPEGGRLTIETANTRLDEAYTSTHDELAPGEFVMIGVSDTGVGMAPEILAKAFEPFFTTKPIGQGTGLGLSMIYGFAKQSGGHVRLYSEPGHGTTVKLYLPRQLVAMEVVSELRPGRLEALRGEQVLLVEDDAAVRMLVVDVLEDLGYTVRQASDAREAMPLLEAADRIDLLITDVGLPGMNGRQLAEIARARRPDLKVLFVTGYAEQAAVRGDFLAAGMDMITKPFAIDALSTKIRQIIEA